MNIQKPVGKKSGEKIIRIGVAGAHSGDLASFGIPTLRAAKLIFDKRNKAGGIFKRKITLIPGDDMCDPKKAVDVAKKMVADKVRIVIGHTCSGATRAALDIYKNSNIIVMSSSATNPALTQSGDFPNFFRSISPDDAQAKLQIRFLTESLKKKNIAIIHDNDDYGKGLGTFARKFVEAGGKARVVLFREIQSGKKTYADVVREIKNANADAVVYGGYHPEAASIVSEMRRMGMKQVFIAGDGTRDAAFIDAAKTSSENAYATGPQDTSKKPLAIDAVQEYKKAYGGKPGPFFLNAYAGTLGIINAIEKSGSLDYDSIVKFLKISYVATPLGTIRFDEKGDVSGYGFSLFQVRDGKFIEVPVDFK